VAAKKAPENIILNSDIKAYSMKLQLFHAHKQRTTTALKGCSG